MELPITLLQNDSTKTLEQIRNGKTMLIDFWHTKCIKCPAALEKLNESATNLDILYCACALSLGEGNIEVVRDTINDWENLTHIFMDMETKELAKAQFGFSAVPFYVVVGKNGTILGSGDPKSFDYQSLLNADSSSSTDNSSSLSFDEDF